MPPPLPPTPTLQYQTPHPPGTGGTPSAPCPNCGNRYANPVKFTWWGGVLGPKILSHVKCAACGTAFNGKTGRSNTTGIVVYSLVGAVIGLAVFFWFFYRGV